MSYFSEVFIRGVYFKYKFYLLFVGKEGACYGMHVVVIGHLVTVCSFLPPHGSWRSNSGMVANAYTH